MDAIFKALNDPGRRALLDALRERDGQTLAELQARLPDLSRFGVMKHLGVLEAAQLIVTRRKGRFKHHYLNAAPLQEVIDRWVEPLLARPMARGLLDLKRKLEGQMDQKPDFVMQTYIRCSQDALWAALTEADAMGAWHFLADRVEVEGEAYHYYLPNGGRMMTARTLEVEPKRRIAATFEPGWEGGGAPSRTVFLIAEEGDHCRLTVEHYALTYPVVPGEGVADGWARWAAGLKTWLETGASVRFAQGPAPAVPREVRP